MASLDDVLMKRLIRNPLSDIGYSISDDRVGSWDLKSLLLCGQLTVESVENSGRCKLSLGEGAYFDALESSFQTGMIRVLRQRKVYEHLIDEKFIPAAWSVVTLYYACFFSVLELMRVSGNWNMFLSASDVKQVNPINAAGMRLEPGTYNIAVTNNDGSSFEVYMSQSGSSGGGFHQNIWDRFRSMSNVSAARLSGGDDKKKCEALREGLKPLKNPSFLRNTWNYRDPLLFGSNGDTIARQTLHKPDKVYREWVRSFHHISTDNDMIFSMLNIYNLTSSLVDNSLRYVLPERKIKQIDSICRQG